MMTEQKGTYFYEMPPGTGKTYVMLQVGKIAVSMSN